MNRKRNGFTTVELVIVIAVIAILATVLIPTFSGLIGKANDSKALQEAKNAHTNYLIEHGGSAPEYMLYQAGERFVALHKGTPKGVYDNKEDALKAIIKDGDPQKLKSNGKFLVYDGVAVSSNPYADKVISIMGDSISTLENYIPSADGFNLEHRYRYVLSAKSDTSLLVIDPADTWWMRVINDLDAKLGINESWAGSCITNNSDSNSGDLGKDACMASLTRIQNLGANGTPNVILFYGGTNDIARCKTGQYTLGTFDDASAPTQADLSKHKWDSVVDAYTEALLRMKYFYPDAQIIAMLPTYTANYYTNELLNQYNTLVSAVCDHYGVTYVDLRNCGISTDLLADGIHPTTQGMECISTAVLSTLKNSNAQPFGENPVYKITHNLLEVTASKHYYKGVSHGVAFTETLTGTNAKVTITMAGKDISSCYVNGEILIPSVTGDIVITAQSGATTWQKIPANATSETNLYTAIQKKQEYYFPDQGWISSGDVISATIYVSEGTQIKANSFGAKGTNGNSSSDGIRLTWFLANGSYISFAPKEVFAEYKASGYLTAPADAIAVNVVWWNDHNNNSLYIRK